MDACKSFYAFVKKDMEGGGGWMDGKSWSVCRKIDLVSDWVFKLSGMANSVSSSEFVVSKSAGKYRTKGDVAKMIHRHCGFLSIAS